MDAVYRQARGLLESAALASGKEEKVSKIALLVELCVHRADAALVDELVTGVSNFTTDRSSSVRRAVLDFLERVVVGSEHGGDACASRAVETAAYLACDEHEGTATRALGVAAVILGAPKFGAFELADVSRERLVAAVDGDARKRQSGAAPGAAYLSAAAETLLALVLRDCRHETGTRPSAATKRGTAALAAAAKSGASQQLLDCCAVALAAAFGLVHKELVAAVIAALEAAPEAAAATAVAALHAAETARRAGGAGAVAAAANKLEAALRRGGKGEAADEALDCARGGRPLPPRPPPEKRGRDEPADPRAAKRRKRDPRARRERSEAAVPRRAEDLEEDRDDAAPDDDDDDDDDDPSMPPPPPKSADAPLTAAAAGSVRSQPPSAPGGRPTLKSSANALSDAHARAMRAAAAARCVAAPPELVARERLYATRDAVVSRLARFEVDRGDVEGGPGAVAATLARAVADKKGRRDGVELALRVLFEAYARERALLNGDSCAADDPRRRAYDGALLTLLAALRDGLESSERALFTDVVLGAPRLPGAAVDFLVRCCDAADAPAAGVALGLTALRDLAFHRPSVRGACLARCLDLTRRADVAAEVREKAVRLASNQLWARPSLRDAVVAHATASVAGAAKPTGQKAEGDDERATALEGVRRELALGVALCVKDVSLVPVLLRNAAATAGRADDSVLVQEAVALELPRLAPALATLHGPEPTLATAAQALKSEAGDAVDADRSKATEALLLSLLEALAGPGTKRTPGLWDGAAKLREAVQASRGSSSDADDTVRFLVPALGSASAAQFFDALPALLLHLDDAALAAAFRRAVAATLSATNKVSGAAATLGAAELVVGLHGVDDKVVPVKRVTEALNVCLAARDVFGALCLRDALDKMTDVGADGDDKARLAKLPQLLMRTCILAVKTYPAQLSSFVASTVLVRLVKMKVWTHGALWKGFMMCCGLLASPTEDHSHTCFAAALALPAPQLSHLLKLAPKLKLPLKRHAEKLIKARDLGGVNPPSLKLLGLEAPAAN